ncbi:MAG TPA: aminoacyl-tRNA synthetase [Noviherbaspirillum sp.]
MRMSDEEYFRSCVAKERHLAHLLGLEVEEYYESAGTLWVNTEPLPKWTRDWAACGPLMAEYRIPVGYSEDIHGELIVAGDIHVHVADHPSRDKALMFAVVRAVIHLIEHDKAHHNDAMRHHEVTNLPGYHH